MRPSPVASLKVYLMSLIGMLVYSVTIAVLSQLGFQLGFWGYIINIAFQWFAFALPVLYYYQKHPEMEPFFRLRSFNLLSGVTVIVAAAIGTIVLNWIALYWVMLLDALGLSISLGESLIPSNGTEFVWVLGYAVLAPAVFEEILFRGFLLPSLESKSVRFAIITSALLFAMLHGSLEALPAHILLGFILALLALCTGSLYTSMLYHAVHNGVIVLIGYLNTAVEATSTNALPTVAEAIAFVPNILFLLFIWVFLLRFSLRHGKKNNASILPVAAHVPLQRSAKVLLWVIGTLLLMVQWITISSMLPGASALL